ncbi:unnamed protein product [Schistosoma margrebowiei]|uniref:Uncharacterized protein n=1 Tax=Schistosoma margrebowiei TaxID=48269 RepID=A0A183MFH6_9TREM|nr:unnamed protein product [Schistosoma margrebowiei]
MQHTLKAALTTMVNESLALKNKQIPILSANDQHVQFSVLRKENHSKYVNSSTSSNQMDANSPWLKSGTWEHSLAKETQTNSISAFFERED